MCLSTLGPAPPDPKASGVGWKVFRQDRVTKRLHSQCLDTHDPWLIGRWYDANPPYRPFGGGPPYHPGFHIFLTRKAAHAWKGYDTSLVIRKVAWKHLLASGKQSYISKDLPVLVALEVKILPTKKRKKSNAA